MKRGVRMFLLVAGSAVVLLGVIWFLNAPAVDPPVSVASPTPARAIGRVIHARTGKPIGNAVVLLIRNEVPGQGGPRLADLRDYAREWSTGNWHRSYGYPGDWSSRLAGIARTGADGDFDADLMLPIWRLSEKNKRPPAPSPSSAPRFVYVEAEGFEPTLFKTSGLRFEMRAVGRAVAVADTKILRLRPLE